MPDQTQGPDRRHSSPRKFTIRSEFGGSRQRRSRKSRPCDICRRRKTACVIPTEPPCLFCRSRGLVCVSQSDQGRSSEGVIDDSSIGSSSAAPESILSPPVVAHGSPDSILPGISAQTEQSQAGTGAAAVVHHGLVDQHQPGTPYVTSPEEVFGPVTSRNSAYTLEDNKDKTTHYMGLAAEQDTYVLDAFRSLILSEDGHEIDADIIQVSRGHPQQGESPVHFLLLEDAFPDHTNAAMRTASEAIENLVWPHGPALVRLYFKYIHPVYPIVSKCRFLQQYSARKEDLPASLRGAVYALASVFRDREPSMQGPSTFQQHELIAHAHTALRRELEAPNLFKLQACLLLLHITPPDIDSVETPSTWILASQATACAQMIGLHRDPEAWKIAPWEKKLRRKMWWAAYAIDTWSAVCHGNPPHIDPASFDTSPPTMDDLRFDEDVPADLKHLIDPADATFSVSLGARFLEMTNIVRTLRDLLDCSFQVTKRQTEAMRHAQLLELKDRLRDWHSLLPNCLAVPGVRREMSAELYRNNPLHLSYYAMKVLLFRALMHPATKRSRATPGSNLRSWFATALVEFEPLGSFMSQLTESDVRGFWGRHARSQLILCGNFLIYLFLLASEPRDIEATYGFLQIFHQSLQRLGATDDPAAKGLLRPATLRIESFFTQAVGLINRAGTDD